MYIYYHKSSGRTYRYYKGISITQLKKKIDRKHNIMIVDVMDDEHFANKHIPTAHNVCYYQIDFVDNFKKLINKVNPKRIIIYGKGNHTYEARNAYIKLCTLGFQNLVIFKGGLDEWEKEGHPLEGSLDQEKKALENIKLAQNKILQIDPVKSQIERSGKNIFKKHIGTIGIKSGVLSMKKSVPVGGNIVLDMNQISDMDIKDKNLNAILVNHLKSDDFFDVERFPEASFDITLAKAMKSENSYYMHGNITIKGIKKLIRIKATIMFLETGEVNIKSQFELNKLDFNILYGSSKIFAGLGKHFIHDKIGIEINLFYK